MNRFSLIIQNTVDNELTALTCETQQKRKSIASEVVNNLRQRPNFMGVTAHENLVIIHTTEGRVNLTFREI
jgi:hypothetical protein